MLFETAYRSVRRSLRPLRRLLFTRSNATIFDRIYKEKRWGTGPDANAPFYSGVGSYDPSVQEYASLVKSVIEEHGIKSVTEIGCGDFAVASQYVDSCQSYVGIDVVKRLIEHNSQLYGNSRVKFLWRDASKSKLDRSDLCIIRQVLQHLSNDDIQKVLKNCQSKFLLITEHLPSVTKIKSYNLDKAAGPHIRVPMGSGVFIDQPPFNLKAKVLVERNVVSDIHESDERLVTWLVIDESTLD